MEPLPQTREAVEEFGPFLDDDLLQVLLDAAERVREVVPSCVGLSLGLLDEGLTFTVQATSEEIAALDAVQYLDGGPCVDVTDDGDDGDGDDQSSAHAAGGPGPEAARTGGDLEDGWAVRFHQQDPLDEERWQWFARATAAAGVSSTLTLPVVVNAQVVGSVNLYAAAVDAFDGHHEAVAAICRAWAPGAVTNADLSFETRRAAVRTPQVLREQTIVSRAIGVLVARRDLSIEDAEATIRDVAVLILRSVEGHDD